MPDFAVTTIFGARDRVTSAFHRMGKSSGKFGDRASRAFRQASNAGQSFRNIMRGAFAYISAREIVQFSNEAIGLWNTQAGAVKNVEAGLISTKMVAGKTLQELKDQASALQRDTFLGDESILQNVTAQVLTFTNITGKEFDRTQAAVLDVTAKLKGLKATGEDLRGTSIMISKAMNDLPGNISAVSRAGIQFTKQQKEQIKTLWESGKISEAQNIFLTEIEKQYGGTAAALAKTNGGLERSFQNTIGDIKEQIGRGLAPIKMEILKTIQGVLPKVIGFAEMVGKGVQQVWPYVKKLGGAFLALGDAVGTIIQTAFNPMNEKNKMMKSGINTIIKVLDFATGIIGNFAAGIKFLSPVLTPLLGLLAGWVITQWALNVAMSANPIGLVIIALGLLIAGIGWVVKNWNNLVTWFNKGISKIWNWFSNLLDNPFFAGIGAVFAPLITVPALIIKHWEPIKRFFSDLYNNILKPVGEFFLNFGSKVDEFVDGVGNGVSDIFKGAFELGEKAGENIRKAITGNEPTRQNPGRTAPNKTEVEARSQVDFTGHIDISGAPEGSKASSKTKGAPPIKMELLGAN